MDNICAQQLGVCESSYKYVSFNDFNKRMISEVPESAKGNTIVNDYYAKINADPNPRKTLRVLQVADPHMDFMYTEGSISNCAQDLCCHKDSTVIEGKSPKYSGKWGDYDCDASPATLTSMLEYIVDNMDTDIKADFVIWTGDNNPHNQHDPSQVNLDSTA